MFVILVIVLLNRRVLTVARNAEITEAVTFYPIYAVKVAFLSSVSGGSAKQCADTVGWDNSELEMRHIQNQLQRCCRMLISVSPIKPWLWEKVMNLPLSKQWHQHKIRTFDRTGLQYIRTTGMVQCLLVILW